MKVRYFTECKFIALDLLCDKYMIHNSLVVLTVWTNREVVTNMLRMPKSKLLRRWLSTKTLDCSSVLLQIMKQSIRYVMSWERFLRFFSCSHLLIIVTSRVQNCIWLEKIVETNMYTVYLLYSNTRKLQERTLTTFPILQNFLNCKILKNRSFNS